MLSKLIGGILYDPAQKVNGELHDIFIRDGFIVCDPGPDARFDEVYDVAGKVVMASPAALISIAISPAVTSTPPACYYRNSIATTWRGV